MWFVITPVCFRGSYLIDLYLYIRIYSRLLVSNTISMSDDVGVVKQYDDVCH